jgi:hypothetical protein
VHDEDDTDSDEDSDSQNDFNEDLDYPCLTIMSGNMKGVIKISLTSTDICTWVE